MDAAESLVGLNVPDASLFNGLPTRISLRWAQYLYTVPKNRAKTASLRSRGFALYNPFAKRSQFPASIRFCVNVYTGCQFACRYCYGRNYVPDPTRPREKEGFMRALDLPPVPLHMSNSTDAFQEILEKKCRHAFNIMELLAANRRHFTTITFLTKNPLLISQPDYVALLDSLKPCQVEVSLAFADEKGRRLYEPCAPSVDSRLEGVRRLREAGIPVSIRIDPLLPREPLPAKFWPTPRLADYGLEHTHTLDEIERLIRFASETGCQKVIVSALKVPVGRWACPDFKEAFRALYGAPWGGKPKTRSFAWRLPEDYIREHLIGEVRQVASRHRVAVTTCWENLVGTK
jgi:DNA repair photolyase